MKIHYGKVYLPHINYTIWFRPFKPRPGHNNVAWIRHKPGECLIYLRENASVFTVVHELVHALQYMCETTGMVFEREAESTATTMEYLLRRAYGYKRIDQTK